MLAKLNLQSLIDLIRFYIGKNLILWLELEEGKLIIKVRLAEENCLRFCKEIIRNFGEPASPKSVILVGEASPEIFYENFWRGVRAVE